MTFIERRTVSRKTPGDGKLEITRQAAERIARAPGPLEVQWSGRVARAELGTMTCTCRGTDRPHEHHYLQSELLRQLDAGAEVELGLDASAGLITLRAV